MADRREGWTVVKGDCGLRTDRSDRSVVDVVIR